MPVFIRFCACAAVTALLVLATVMTASSQITAQAGSAGGSLGKKGKSASGGEEAAPPPQVTRSKRKTSTGASAGKTSPKGCGNFFGTWTSGGGSWLYGANDTVFRSDGTARHSSGIVGTWTCSNGVIDLIWKDWDHDQIKLSDDGKRLDSIIGGRGFTR